MDRYGIDQLSREANRHLTCEQGIAAECLHGCAEAREYMEIHANEMIGIACPAVDQCAARAMSTSCRSAEFAIERHIERSTTVAHFNAWICHVADHFHAFMAASLIALGG